ncbi:retroviral-like aspartic protease, partial [Salmonella enterica subsp. enterica serovar Goldcoast]|nr:retroviral-like aspartic protease [Salmonella enterica subsp. enterica serovar Goldcoast]
MHARFRCFYKCNAFSIYKSLNLGPLEETGIIIQLADRSYAYPLGIVEDVLVKVNELVFPVDFYILNMEDEGALNPIPILLGRPFLVTAKTKIDVSEGTLSMEFDGQVIKFSLFDAMKYPCDSTSLCSVETIDAIDLLVQQVFELGKEDSLE